MAQRSCWAVAEYIPAMNRRPRFPRTCTAKRSQRLSQNETASSTGGISLQTLICRSWLKRGWHRIQMCRQPVCVWKKRRLLCFRPNWLFFLPLLFLRKGVSIRWKAARLHTPIRFRWQPVGNWTFSGNYVMPSVRLNLLICKVKIISRQYTPAW